MGEVIILQGIPGIGKSTFAIQNFPNAVICSADDYMFENGVYVWKANKLGYCHQSCINKFKTAVLNKTETVIVDNTNTKVADIRPYVNFARENNYEIVMIWLKGDPEKYGPRNTHGVPQETVRIIHERLVNFNSSLLELERKIIEV